MANVNYYYVYSNGDGTWTLHSHGRHPDINDDKRPFTADELLEELKEYGFHREEILEKNVEGLSSALKKK